MNLTLNNVYSLNHLSINLYIYRENTMKFFTTAVTLIMLFSLTACNTMAGIGKDIQEGGEALERSAQ